MLQPRQPTDDAAILAIERPHPNLFTYYWVSLLLVPPAFPLLILPMWFRYHTMRYTFTAEGISMRWGILFRREVIVNYARIQDIHLRSNILERWLGLARVLVQTASGSSSAEMTLEGLQQYEAVRDFLYARMRGVKEGTTPHPAPASSTVPVGPDSHGALVAALRDATHELREIRVLLAARSTKGPPDV